MSVFEVRGGRVNRRYLERKTKFDLCSMYLDLLDQFEKVQARADLAAERERELSVRIYNHGYKAGHHDTVESVYTDIHEADMSSYHSDEVGELLSDLATQPHSREGGEEK